MSISTESIDLEVVSTKDENELQDLCNIVSTIAQNLINITVCEEWNKKLETLITSHPKLPCYEEIINNLQDSINVILTYCQNSPRSLFFTILSNICSYECGIQSFCRVGGCHIVASSLLSGTEDESLTCAGLMLLERISIKLDNEIVIQIIQENICPLIIKLISMHCTSEEILHLGLSVLNNIGKNENIRNEFTQDALVPSLENVIVFNQSNYSILNECLETLVIYSYNKDICKQLVNSNFIDTSEELLNKFPKDAVYDPTNYVLQIYHQCVVANKEVAHITNVLAYTCNKIKEHRITASILKPAFHILSDIDKSDYISIDLLKEMDVAQYAKSAMRSVPTDEKLQTYVLKTLNNLVARAAMNLDDLPNDLNNISSFHLKSVKLQYYIARIYYNLCFNDPSKCQYFLDQNCCTTLINAFISIVELDKDVAKIILGTMTVLCSDKPDERKMELQIKDMKELLRIIFLEENKSNLELFAAALTLLSRMVGNQVMCDLFVSVQGMEKINEISLEAFKSSPELVKPSARIVGFIGRNCKAEHKLINSEAKNASINRLCQLVLNYADNLKLLSVIFTSLKCLCDTDEDYEKLSSSKNDILAATYFTLEKSKDLNQQKTALYLASKLDYRDIACDEKYKKLIKRLFELIANSEDAQLVEYACKLLSVFSENTEIKNSMKESVKLVMQSLSLSVSPLRTVSNRFPGNTKLKRYSLQTLHNLEGTGCFIM